MFRARPRETTAFAIAASSGVLDHVADERRVDLEHVDGHLAQPRERRVADAEVVDGDGGARLFEPAQMLADGLALGERRGFGDLDVEASARERLRLEHGENVFHESRGRELAHRDVDREVQGLAVDLGERLHGLHSPAQHQVAEGDDQARVLGEGNELGRERRGAVRGIGPAHQGLEGDRTPRAAIHDGLEVDLEPRLRDGVAQAALHRYPPLHVLAQGGGEELMGVASHLLRAVHGEVCRLQQPVAVGPVVREHRDADARRHHQLVARGVQRRAQRVHELLGHEQRPALIGVGEDREKLIAPRAGPGCRTRAGRRPDAWPRAAARRRPRCGRVCRSRA
jgi:hypothetical protein